MHANGFSVRRTLFALCAAYLAGIYFSGCVSIPEPILYIISVLCVCAGVIRLHTRRSALFFLLGFMLIAGYCAAVRELSVYDRATQPGVSIEGVITRKTKDLRVMLCDVVVNGETALKRPVLVTLMVEEDENGEPLEVREACIGQRVAGTGRLFEQETVRNPGGVDRRIQAISEGYDLSGYILPGWTAEGNGRFSLHEACRQAKMLLSAQIGELFGESAPLYQAMLIGDRTHMEQELVQAMRLSGVAHLLTISGMHLTMIAHAVSWLLMKTLLGRRTSFVIKAMVVVGYTCLTGGAAGTVRACIMTLHKETALLCGRRYDPLTALAAAALCMTIVNPVWALSAQKVRGRACGHQAYRRLACRERVRASVGSTHAAYVLRIYAAAGAADEPALQHADACAHAGRMGGAFPSLGVAAGGACRGKGDPCGCAGDGAVEYSGCRAGMGAASSSGAIRLDGWGICAASARDEQAVFLEKGQERVQLSHGRCHCACLSAAL